jgi:hypothetical protein
MHCRTHPHRARAPHTRPQVLADSDDEEVADLEIKVRVCWRRITHHIPAVPQPNPSNQTNQPIPTDFNRPTEPHRQVPTSKVKRIVGPGGANIKEIQKKSK